MQTRKSALFAILAFTLGALPVAAQDAKAVEVTPYVALGSAGASPVGAAVAWPITATLSFETDVAYRRGEGDVNALSSSISLLYSLPRLGQLTPYFAAGVGLRQYGAPLLSGDGPPVGTQSRLGTTVNAGAGVTLPLGENFGLRTDARWFKSIGEQGSEQFRVAQGISFGTRKR